MSDEATNNSVANSATASNSEATLRETLKRCSPETIEAALAYKSTGDLNLVPTVVLGIVERFLEPEMVDVLKNGDDSVKFMEDLGLDSLTMFEAIMMVEESLGISIKNEELLDLRSVGDLKRFIAQKISGADAEVDSKFFPLEKIAAVMPQQDPFLFLQTAEISGGNAKGTYTISGEEAFLAGHFKDDPVFPASIMLESLGQLGVFHFLKTEPEAAEGSLYFAGADGVRCHRICRPGDTLKLQVELKRRRDPMVVYSAKIYVGDEKAVSADEISLIFAEAGTEIPGK